MKKYKFLFFTLLLAFLFIPKNVFAADTNIISPGSQELFWDGTNAAGGYESQRFSSTQNHLYNWGSAYATYTLYRFAPLVNFQSLGVDTTYKARVAFYVFTSYPYSYDDNYCTLWSANNEKFSCSLYRKMEDQIGSSEVLLTLVYDYEWTSSTGYVEFWSNFTNFKGVPAKTQFMYTILDWQGNVSSNQIVLDSLGETNKKLDEIKDTIKDSFQDCKTSPNLVEKFENGTGTSQGNGVLFIDSELLPNTTYTLSGKGTPGYNYYINESLSTQWKSFVISSDGSFKMTFTTTSSVSLSNGSQSNGSMWRILKNNSNDQQASFYDIQLEKGSTATKYYPFGKNICTNKIDETNDKLDDLNNTLNNDDVSGSTSTGNDFFDNFNDSDNGGISGIITAPLNAINAMLNGTCQPLSTTFRGKTISLECGTDMWNKLSSIRNFLNLVLGGLLCYRICLKIFHIVQNLKNPDNDKVEVMNL